MIARRLSEHEFPNLTQRDGSERNIGSPERRMHPLRASGRPSGATDARDPQEARRTHSVNGKAVQQEARCFGVGTRSIASNSKTETTHTGAESRSVHSG